VQYAVAIVTFSLAQHAEFLVVGIDQDQGLVL
jgi:hypothetical protein